MSIALVFIFNFVFVCFVLHPTFAPCAYIKIANLFRLVLRVERTEVDQIWKRHKAIIDALHIYLRF